MSLELDEVNSSDKSMNGKGVTGSEEGDEDIKIKKKTTLLG